MTAFLRHLRVLGVLVFAGLVLGACTSSNLARPAVYGLGVAGGGAAGAAIGCRLAGTTGCIVGGAVGALGGLVVTDYAVKEFGDSVGVPQGGTFSYNGRTYQKVGGQYVEVGSAGYGGGYGGYSSPVVSAPVTASAGYGAPQSSGGLPVDNPVSVRACKPTAMAPARAVTSTGTPWVSCGRPGAGEPLFR